ncbi:hypothetical protein HA402_010605 [Bradysia odoriphaga]|nr:hypothetical protein HA402_010605 [Bradysia odoriphaga]
MEPFWEPNGHAPHSVKYESDTAISGFGYCNENGLNFSTSAAYSEDDENFASGRRGKSSRQDPLSHRIIEKRRRDRMNSCLADLSRLIPPQYQRKGRGRIEKTEIIEMSIRYMKQLQNAEYMHKENVYKMGYDECLKQAANFLYNGHRDICYQLIDHLKEVIKGDCYKVRSNNIDSISASSGSPPIHGYHPIAPLNQLHDMLSTTDMEHSNSNDHNDIKDLSLRGQPQQAPVITSTAPLVHLDTTSNHDFDSSRASSVHLDNTPHDGARTARMRKLSESSHHENEHNSNSYKFKNYIQQRFSQDLNHLDDHEVSVINECGNKSPSDAPCKKKMCLDFMESSSCDEKPSTNGITEFKNEVHCNAYPIFSKPCGLNSSLHSSTVPIFALHAQGRYYVPLNVDYESLLPYLSGSDLFDKQAGQMPPLHAININVNFAYGRSKPISSQSRHKLDNISNGW